MPKQKQKTSDLDLNPEFLRAVEMMESDVPFLFITGRAGTGKSTLLSYFRSHTKKRCAYLAPTGVAALNVNGETIHSFFRFTPGISLTDARRLAVKADKNLFQKIDSIVIDEISMVRADLLDCVDVFMRRVTGRSEPFGGKQIIAIGDLYQLPPVVTSHEVNAFAERYETPYFFSSDAVKELSEAKQIQFIELEKVYRQSDTKFVDLLNGVRNRSISDASLAALNARVSTKYDKRPDGFIYLTPTNAAADEINQINLACLSTQFMTYRGIVNDSFPEKDLPTDASLTLAVNARVMFVKNDAEGRWVNGTLGKVVRLRNLDLDVLVDGEEEPITVEAATWTLYRSVYDSETHGLSQERLGSFSQIPLRLAWATTIHKSQGKSFDRVVVDLGRGAFAAGQVYVALSRCRTFEGLILTKPVTKPQLRLDYRVIKFITQIQYSISQELLSTNEKIEVLNDAIANGKSLVMTYLKINDEKSRRRITPSRVYDAEHQGIPFIGLDAYCHLRGSDRVFDVEKILVLEEEG